MIRWLRARRAARLIAAALEDALDRGEDLGADLERLALISGATLEMRARAAPAAHPEMWAVETELVALDDPRGELRGHLPRAQRLKAAYLRREHAETVARVFEVAVAAGQDKARSGR